MRAEAEEKSQRTSGKKQALSLFSPSPRLAEVQKEGSMQEMQEYIYNVLVYM
jgi:hypothetical protein